MWPSSPAAPLVPASIAPPNTRGRSHTGANGDEEVVAAAAAASELGLGEPGGTHVVVHAHRHAEVVLEERSEGTSRQPRFAAYRARPAAGSTRPGTARPYGTDAHPRAEVSGERPDGAHDGRWAVKDRSRTQLTPYLGAIGVDDQPFHHECRRRRAPAP